MGDYVPLSAFDLLARVQPPLKTALPSSIDRLSIDHRRAGTGPAPLCLAGCSPNPVAKPLAEI